MMHSVSQFLYQPLIKLFFSSLVLFSFQAKAGYTDIVARVFTVHESQVVAYHCVEYIDKKQIEFFNKRCFIPTLFIQRTNPKNVTVFLQDTLGDQPKFLTSGELASYKDKTNDALDISIGVAIFVVTSDRENIPNITNYHIHNNISVQNKDLPVIKKIKGGDLTIEEVHQS